MPLLPIEIKIYNGFINQEGESAPTINILHNTLGTITWTRYTTGQYVGTLTGKLIQNKTEVWITNNQNPNYAYTGDIFVTPNSIMIQSYTLSGGTFINADTLLINIPIEIRVYK